MSTRLQNFWERLRSSYWFLPSLMALGAVALSFGTEAADRVVRLETVESIAWIYSGGPEGARAVLSTIAGSMITVTGVVFSLTMVALVVASSQFGPRLLGNFMKDTGNQVVLGTFTATFLYCLLALRLVSGVEDARFVPHISITVGLLSGLVSIGVLIYFIDHVASSIQAPNVIARVGADLDAIVEKAFPEASVQERAVTPGSGRLADVEGDAERPAPGGAVGAEPEGAAVEPEPAGEPPTEPIEPALMVTGERSGYVQSIDTSRLVSAAEKHAVRIRLAVRPGDFVIRGSPLADVQPVGADASPEEDEAGREALNRSVRRAFIFGNRRTLGQDPRFVLEQLVEIAVRALSPGVNDPVTAVNCIDRIGAALAEVARRPRPVAAHRDDAGQVRLVLAPVTFSQLLDAAFDPIREHGRRDTMVAARLLQTIGAIGRLATRANDRAALLRHAEKVRDSAFAGPEERPGAERIADRFETTAAVLGRGADASPGA